MTRRVAVDTGPLIALFDRSDVDHAAAVRFFAHFRERGFVTTAVIAEVTHLLSYHSQAPVDFLRWLQSGALEIEEIASDLQRVVALMVKYADLPMDFADATIVAGCERLGIRDIATLDSDFVIYRYKDRQVFHNLFPA